MVVFKDKTCGSISKNNGSHIKYETKQNINIYIVIEFRIFFNCKWTKWAIT